MLEIKKLIKIIFFDYNQFLTHFGSKENHVFHAMQSIIKSLCRSSLPIFLSVDISASHTKHSSKESSAFSSSYLARMTVF